MKSEKIEFLSAVLITSQNAGRLANFYREVIGIPLEDEQHGETEKHYGCELGDLHFAIHPVSNFKGSESNVGSIKLAFTVFDMDSFVKKLQSLEVNLEYPPKDMGFAIMTALKDPDGNLIEFTQLSDGWFRHLDSRRKEGMDVVTRWKSENKV